MTIVLSALIAYVLGSLNFSIILSKFFFTGNQLTVERRDAAPQVCVRIRLRTQLLESRNSFQRFGFGVFYAMPMLTLLVARFIRDIVRRRLTAAKVACFGTTRKVRSPRPIW